MSKINFKTKKGITLIALVVTIIVLLILAGVALSLVLGENGITERAVNAGKTQNIAGAKEQFELEVANLAGEFYQAKYVNNQGVGSIQDYIMDKLANVSSIGDYSLSTSGTKATLTATKESDRTTVTATIDTDGKVIWGDINFANGDSGIVTNPYENANTWVTGWTKNGDTWSDDIPNEGGTVLSGDIIARVYPLEDETYHLVIEKPTITGSADGIKDIKKVASLDNLKTSESDLFLGWAVIPTLNWRVGYKDTISKITICSGITEIEEYWFCGCSSLTSVVIPDSVTVIGRGAFLGCESLESIIIPDGVSSVGSQAFSGCINLRTLTLPSNVQEVGYGAFSDCSSLRSVTIPNSITSISTTVFSRCSNLSFITFKGTQGEWNAITGHDNVTGIDIVCTDGTISGS